MDLYEEMNIPKSFSELINSIYQNHDKVPKAVKEKRKELTKSIEKFHKEAGTLTENVRKDINELKNKNDNIIEYESGEYYHSEVKYMHEFEDFFIVDEEE